MASSRSTPSVRVCAPVRIADVGGWTDTWFARHGAVCHLGVDPGVVVEVSAARADQSDFPVHLEAPDIGASFSFGPAVPDGWSTYQPVREPLLEHAVASVFDRQPCPDPVRVTIRSAVPAGASVGTSASVLVALIAALETFAAGSPSEPLTAAERHRIAATAHRVETERAGRQAGVQDHWAAAFGGAQLLRIDRYPQVEANPIILDRSLREACNTRLVTVVFAAHDSSAVHAEVIARFEGDTLAKRKALGILDRLSRLAHGAADALDDGDFTAWATICTEATRYQSELHPGLVTSTHRRAIDLARRDGAVGWKVNGAGGNGGSVTIAFGTEDRAGAYRQRVKREHPTWRVLELHCSEGVRRIDVPTR